MSRNGGFFYEIDSHGGMDKLGAQLRKAAELSRVQLSTTMAEIGEEHAAAAKQLVGQHSTSIPPTIKAEPLPGAVKLTAGDGSSPLPVLYEKGNRKGGGRSGFQSKRKAGFYGSRGLEQQLSFRHPVYGNRNVWVDQPRFPFFSAARRLLRKRTKAKLDAGWARVFDRSGIHVRKAR